KTLARVKTLELWETGERPAGAAAAILEEVEIFVPLEGLVDVATEINKLENQRQKTLKELERSEKKLSNPNFLSRAPQEVVSKERERVAALKEKIARLERNISLLKEAGV
ncbi:MAG TPA: valine--tRNA ligase, partial [Thermodesulfatator sp.]|nr:valine--tRNA ligase [Thermodesulfatator sp.]